MALTGIQIYKHLPRTNCKDCGFPTCLAFAMKLAQKQAPVDKCPHISDDAKAVLAEESAPPIRKVIIGTSDKKVTIGEETVLFRHEKTFVHPPAITLQVEDTLGADKLAEKIKQVQAVCFERVGQNLRAGLIMVKNSSADKDKFIQAINTVKANSDLPLILAGKNAANLEAGLEILSKERPLIHAAAADNYEAMATLAKKYQCPLAVSSAEVLEKLAELAEKVAGLGVKDIVLEPVAASLGAGLSQLTQIRRAALKKSAKGLGYPVMVCAAADTDDPIQEALCAGVYVMRYASIIVLKAAEDWQLLPLLTLTQNIYTDPQKPLQVEENVYKIG